MAWDPRAVYSYSVAGSDVLFSLKLYLVNESSNRVEGYTAEMYYPLVIMLALSAN